MLETRFAHNVADLLIPLPEFRPYPAAGERGPWDGLPERLREARIAQGERYLGYQWPQLSATGFMEFARSGNRSNFERGSFARRTALSELVLAECIEGKGRFIDDIINGIWTICEESFWGVPAHNYGDDPLPDVEVPYIDLFAGETGGLLAWTHYLLRTELDRVSPRITKRIRYEIKRRILDPYFEHDDFWWMGFTANRKVNNWNPWCNANCLTAFLLMEDDEERRVGGVKKVLRSLDRFLAVYHSDGGCDEGTSYWSRAGGSLFDCLELLYTASDGRIDVYDAPLIQEIGRYLYRMYIDNDWFVNFADGSARVEIAADVVYRYGARIKDDKLMALGSSAHHMNPHSGLRHKDSLIRDLAAVFNFATIEVATPKPPYVRDTWLGGVQVMTAREREGSPRGLYVAAKGGHNNESHNHNDVGNFIVYLNGGPAIVDAGVETYTKQTFSSRRYELWTMQSAYHNLPTLGTHQQLPGESFRATDVEYQVDPEHARLSMDIRSAYPEEAGIVRWRRTIRLNRKAPKASVEVVDDFRLASPTPGLWLTLLVAGRPIVEGDSIAVGNLLIRFDAEQLDVAWERITIEDRRLQRAWGEALHRMRLMAREAVDQGVWRLAITEA